ncbi:membrane-bound lytic murein transglycosylase MltF [Thioalkalivibrio sp. XN279]|uniref:membrane-bound lytic murein transglycosylase MltF n=1 Tax=Thioalkalivibrio sp. XN279 TaxID=2714953 RepID=UPI00140913A9|nr:membrane-bound lytic murein transglycosylase MltF [Thioalkalivibrio sp. XN279]NHA15609.1 membrane-bound lytic murein transglycosylase MltF [Thioalkalivibrio sp. XN279]
MRLLAILALGLLLVTCSQPLTLLEQVEREGILRVVTRNAPTTYYIGSEGPAGPEYDLALGFAEFLGVELEIYTVDNLAQVLPEVTSGRAHLAAAALTITPARQEEVAFGPVYRTVTQQLVYRRGSWRPRSLDQLVGTRLEVIAGSSYVDTLEQLRRSLPGLTWLEHPSAETQELLAQVADGKIDHTVADSTTVLVNRYFHPDIRVAMDLSEAQSIAWAFRAGEDDSLLQQARAYFAEISANGRIAEIMDRYYSHTDRFDYVGTRTFLRHVESRLPRYRAWFEEAAAEYGFDWRLLAALSYQESHWNPHAVSPTGVRGLMMLTRSTAAAMGVEDRDDPEQSIRGGARYLRRVIGKIPERIPEPDRTWMALAGYNVGFGHLEDARRITEIRGLDPDRWAHVRDSLPLLTQERWHKQARFGYARGWEPVRYVDNIRRYYEVMGWITAEPRTPFAATQARTVP